MSQRNGQAPADTAVRVPGRPSSPSEPFHPFRPSVSTAGTARSAGAAGVRLTGRGAMLGVFVLCFVGLIVSDWSHRGALSGGTFVAACVLAAVWTQRADLLTVAATPPALFLVAVICEKALMPSGSLVLSTTEGTLITLADTAPWLLAGMAVSLIIAFSRGLWQNIGALCRDLRGDPVRKPAAHGQLPGDG